jgi:lipid-binding SYLF domain-containing protein
MKIAGIAILAIATLISTAFADTGEKERKRINDSGQVLKEILATPDKGIPNDILAKAKCVIVLPSVKKAALGIGGSYGRGAMTCRTGEGASAVWSAPVMMALEGGSIGFQLGGEATDFVILVMNDKGANAILKSKVKLGGDASVAAGPVGRTAEASTSANLQAEMLSYSRSKGVFGGVSLAGSTLRSDDSGNESLYGKKISAEDILQGKGVTPPVEAKALTTPLKEQAQSAAK